MEEMVIVEDEFHVSSSKGGGQRSAAAMERYALVRGK